MINTDKIKARMKEYGITQTAMASKMGLAAPTLSQKLGGKRPMFLDEADAIARILEIRNDQFGAYFFGE